MDYLKKWPLYVEVTISEGSTVNVLSINCFILTTLYTC